MNPIKQTFDQAANFDHLARLDHAIEIGRPSRQGERAGSQQDDGDESQLRAHKYAVLVLWAKQVRRLAGVSYRSRSPTARGM